MAEHNKIKAAADLNITDDEYLQIQQEKKDLRAVCATPEGQRVMRRVIGQGQIFRAVHYGNSKDIYLKGKRDLARWLIAQIADACPEQLGGPGILIDFNDK